MLLKEGTLVNFGERDKVLAELSQGQRGAAPQPQNIRSGSRPVAVTPVKPA
jgi:ABC-type protease/lipase transport system fused ATPase/permease subunit